MRKLTLALALVAAQGCKTTDSREHADQSAELDARRAIRYRALEAQLEVVATQPIVINALATAFPLTDVGRASVTEKLRALQMRLDEARNQIGLVKTSLASHFEDADAKATEAMKKLDAARRAAWDALDKAPRTDRSS